MLATRADVSGLLRCPRNGDPLYWDGPDLRSELGTRYRLVGGQPVLVDFERSTLDEDWVIKSSGASVIPRKASAVRRFIKAHLLHGGADEGAEANAHRFLKETERVADKPLILVIGGGTKGIGTDVLYGSRNARVVGFDVYATPITHFIADAHRIPVADGVFDGVWIQYVLEHVLEPWSVAREIFRVLKPNGVVYSETPFLQQVHEGAHDFCRFTHSGHRWLFKDFQEIDSGIAMGQGPQLLWSLEHLARGLTRSRKLGQAVKLLFFWLQYVDHVIPKRFKYNSASSFYFIGTKGAAPIHPKVMNDYYGIHAQ